MKQISGEMSKDELKQWAIEEIRLSNSIIKRYRGIAEPDTWTDRTIYYWKGHRGAMLLIIQQFVDPAYPTEEEYLSWPH